MKQKIRAFVYIIALIGLTFNHFFPIVYEHIKTKKTQDRLKEEFNNRISYLKEEEVEYFKKIKIIINNNDYFNDIDIYRLIIEEYSEKNNDFLQKILLRLENLNEKEIFLKFSMTYNLGIFLPIFFPILNNLFVIFKNVK